VPAPELPSRAVVDLDAFAANVEALRAQAPSALMMTVVKADGYGHGLLPVARAALAGGADWLGVAQLGEALALRAAGIEAPLLAWLYTPGEDLDAPLCAGVDLGVSSMWALREVAEAARRTGRTARVHVKVDTGLARGGLLPADLPALLAEVGRLQADGVVAMVGAFSHLACADTPGHPSIQAQVDCFTEALAVVARAGIRLELRHLANSAALVTRPDTHFDLVRAGIASYGLTPVPVLGGPERFGLTPVMTLKGRLAGVKDVPAGTAVSYGHTYVTSRDTRLGLVPLGYGDGIPRSASGVGPMSVGGQRHTIAGRVCMDQVVLDLGPDSPARPGDEVIVFGPAATGGPSAQEWADVTGTISYEIVTRIGVRVTKEYVGTRRGGGV
jgi:alanine racemase